MAGVIGQELLPERCVFLLCDVQERFREHISHFSDIVAVCDRMLKAAACLNIPVIATEQYPKGLGSTVEELHLESVPNVSKYEKCVFSMCIPEVVTQLNALKAAGVTQAVLFGIETHVCIQQTALDLIGEGFEVYVVADGCSSRGPVDRHFALKRLAQAGVIVTTHESVLLQSVRSKDHPQFKAIQAVIRTLVGDTGLLNKL